MRIYRLLPADMPVPRFTFISVGSFLKYISYSREVTHIGCIFVAAEE